MKTSQSLLTRGTVPIRLVRGVAPSITAPSDNALPVLGASWADTPPDPHQGQALAWPWAAAASLAFAQLVEAATLVPAQSAWKYLDDGSDLVSAWREVGFNDSTWPAGRAQLGYGDGDEATPISYGADANNKSVTTYFRLAFVVADPAAYADLTLSLLRDDGAVVYLNGIEVFRSNLPSGAIDYRTLASGTVGGVDEDAFYPTTLGTASLVAGTNMLAVEVHQGSLTSSDLSFDLELVGNRPPVQVSLDSPLNGATEVSRDAPLGASISATYGEPLVVTFYGRPADTQPGPDFTVVALPDTQYYVSSKYGGVPETFVAQAEWIVTNRVPKNIAFVTQLGDCVENGDNSGNDLEWRHATNALYRLENPITTGIEQGLPYGVAVGNHDQSALGDPNGTTTFYNQYFGEAHFFGRSYYGGHDGTNNDNHYEVFSASGLDFIAVHLEYDPAANTNVLHWANQLLQTHPARRAIVISHYLMEQGNGGAWGRQGRATYEALKNNPNLFLMLCGHVAGEGRRSDTNNAHVVHTLLSDFQGRTNGGSGFLRLLEFSPSNQVIRVKTYSATFGQYEADADSQFTLEYDMNRRGPFTVLGTFPGLTAATNLVLPWAQLAQGTTYEWRVTVSDGTTTWSSGVQRFTTASNTPPSVVLTRVDEAPVSGFVPSVTLALEAEATDSDGGVAKVEFYTGTTKIGEDAASPFDCTWYHVPIGTYRLTAVAEDNGGLRSTSAPVNVLIELPGQTGGLQLRAPSSLAATAASASQINLEWSDNSTNETGFVLERSSNGTDFIQIALTAADATTFQDAGLEAATPYTYRIYAFDRSMASAYSKTASAATLAVTVAPFKLSLQFDRANNLIRLTWSTTPGMVYRVVVRDNLRDAGWTDLSQDITASAETASWAELMSQLVPHRFYGIRLVR